MTHDVYFAVGGLSAFISVHGERMFLCTPQFCLTLPALLERGERFTTLLLAVTH